jgi:hypothetical protein
MSAPFGCACRWQDEKGQVEQCGTHREVADAILALIPRRHKPLLCTCGMCKAFRLAAAVPALRGE